MFHNFDLEHVIITLVVLVVSISLHEFGHAFSADRLGDDTPRRQGRVTLWPDKHFDMFGFIMIVVTTLFGFGIGWGKPVQVDFRNFKNVRRDDIIVTACGPLMNLLLALFFGMVLRILIATGGIHALNPSITNLFLSFLTINLSLMFFNLLPIYPLDGSHIVRRILSPDLGEPYYRFMQQWGPLILMLLIISGGSILGTIIGPAVSNMTYLILGLPR